MYNESAHPPGPGSDPRNLIINYIPTPVSEEELRQLFAQFGDVESARIIVDRANGQPKGYGFVKFLNEDSAQEAIRKMNGFEIHQKRLKVTTARGPAALTRGNAAGSHGGVSASSSHGGAHQANTTSGGSHGGRQGAVGAVQAGGPQAFAAPYPMMVMGGGADASGMMQPMMQPMFYPGAMPQPQMVPAQGGAMFVPAASYPMMQPMMMMPGQAGAMPAGGMGAPQYIPMNGQMGEMMNQVYNLGIQQGRMK